jgi:REP element-mobilizing transposase RayT
LERGSYRGVGAAHWTFSLEDRATGWLTPVFHAHFREILAHATARFACAAPAYCLMPDHIHVVLWNLGEESDSYLAARFLRQFTSKALHPAAYQKQAYDHVLTEKELARPAFETACLYVLENPVRAALCSVAADYPFSGSLVPGYPELRVHEEGYWDVFWKIVCKKMNPPQPRA